MIVDDGSPIEYDVPAFNLNIIWLKINEDIAWNQAGARNLGVTYAKSDKIVITDLDHELFEETFDYLIRLRHPDRSFFKIYRNDAQGNVKKGHSNLFFMSRARFMRHFGYDEEFSGHYGAEDYRFVNITSIMAPDSAICQSDIDALKEIWTEISLTTPYPDILPTTRPLMPERTKK